MTNRNASTKGFTRRSLLRRGAAASAIVAAPIIIPSHVLGKPGRPGANDRIGVAGIGVGRRGGYMLHLGHGPNPVVAVADVDLNRARKVASKYKADAYQDYRKVLERKDVDVIITATTDHWRSLVCIHAAQAGKDIYAEKPMTLTIAEGRKMAQAVRKYNRVFQTGSQQRSMEKNIIGCAMVRAGRAGKIKRVVAQNYPSPWPCRLPGQPVPEGLDWDRWCGPVSPVPYNQDIFRPRANPGWISFTEFSGGEMTGWGSHGFDMIQWALGTDDTGPVRVWTEGDKCTPPILKEPHSRKAGESKTVQPKIFMEYANGVVMELANGPHGGGLFYGDKGMIGIDRGRFWSDPKELTAEPLKPEELPEHPGKTHFDNFYECVKSRKRCIADVEIGHRSGTICHLGNIARFLGRELKWDPKAEKFVGDDQANQMLDRPRRKGYELPDKV